MTHRAGKYPRLKSVHPDAELSACNRNSEQPDPNSPVHRRRIGKIQRALTATRAAFGNSMRRCAPRHINKT